MITALAIAATTLLVALGKLQPSVGAAVIGAAAAFVGLAQRILRPGRRPSAPAPPSIEARLQQATASLRDASDVMSAVERELRVRQARLQAISEDYAHMQRLANLDRETANVVRDELAKVVKGEGRRSFWLMTVITVVITAVLGVAAGVAAIPIAHYFFPSIH